MNDIKTNIKSIKYGFMVWWKNIEGAACYNIKLYIGTDVEKDKYGICLKREYDEIAVVEKDRKTLYHSFVNLARVSSSYGRTTNLNYYIKVEAEDREGNILAQSSTLKADVLE